MKTLGCFVSLTFILLACGCGGVFKGLKSAQQGVVDFHGLYDDAKFSEIYKASHSKFQKATTEKDWADLIGAVHRKLGKVKDSTQVRFNQNTFNLTTTVVLIQNTTFERGSGTETFSFQMEGEKAKLVAYNVSSKDLILK